MPCVLAQTTDASIWSYSSAGTGLAASAPSGRLAVEGIASSVARHRFTGVIGDGSSAAFASTLVSDEPDGPEGVAGPGAARPSREAYRRASARRHRYSRLPPSSGKIARPQETGARSRSASAMRATLARASSAFSSGRITANSSPPSRPTASAGRTTRWSVCATQQSSSSPAAWPKVSLTGLKWSMSSTTTAPFRPLRCMPRICASAASSKPRRFRQPVSGSVREAVARSLCWRLWFCACQALIAEVQASAPAKAPWKAQLDPPETIATPR